MSLRRIQAGWGGMGVSAILSFAACSSFLTLACCPNPAGGISMSAKREPGSRSAMLHGMRGRVGMHSTNLALRGGGLFPGTEESTSTAQHWMRQAAATEVGNRGRSDRVLDLLRMGMADADIVVHPSLRGWQATLEYVAQVRAAWVEGGGVEEMEAQERADRLNKRASDAMREELGGMTDDEIRARATRKEEERARADLEQEVKWRCRREGTV